MPRVSMMFSSPDLIIARTSPTRLVLVWMNIPYHPERTISSVNVLHRHGSRYPTSNSSVQFFGQKIPLLVANGTANFTGALSFLNTWTYKLGAEVLVPVGHKELFDSGVRFYYD